MDDFSASHATGNTPATAPRVVARSHCLCLLADPDSFIAPGGREGLTRLRLGPVFYLFAEKIPSGINKVRTYLIFLAHLSRARIWEDQGITEYTAAHKKTHIALS